jgi:large subunit ribosomal protein L21
MYAIVSFKGFQYRVAEDQVVRVPSIDHEVGDKVVMEDVLFIGGSEPRVGAPTVPGSQVEGEVVSHGRGKKVIVGKFMRRRDYHRKNGHRQNYTEVRITKIAG